MNSYNAAQVLNGTWGELWIGGDYLAEVTAFQATVTLTKVDVNMTRKLAKYSKVVGYEGKGTIKINHVSSYFVTLMNDNMKVGKQTSVTIISKVDDPDALGAERIVIKDAVFDELSLANWESKKNVEDSIPFTFTDWDVLDSILD
jgi:predicted RNA-binding protein with RPS1 domain